jgi:hypothetical protein
MAERFGARRSGQWFASGATVLGGLVLGVGHLLSTATSELLGWVLITYLALRVTARDRGTTSSMLIREAVERYLAS